MKTIRIELSEAKRYISENHDIRPGIREKIRNSFISRTPGGSYSAAVSDSRFIHKKLRSKESGYYYHYLLAKFFFGRF